MHLTISTIRSSTFLSTIVVLLLSVTSQSLQAQTREHVPVSIDIYYRSYVSIHTLVDHSPEMVLRAYPESAGLATVDDPSVLRRFAALIDGIENRPPSWYRGIDTRIVCILRSPDRSTDTLAFGNWTMRYHGRNVQYDPKLLLLVAEQLPLYFRSEIEDFVATDLQRESLLHAWASDTCHCRGDRTRERLESLFEWVNFESGSREWIVRHLGEPDFEKDVFAASDSSSKVGISLGYFLQPPEYKYRRERSDRCFVTFTIWSKRDSVTTTFNCADR
jgi:hypothetical protein